jgi:hypothetical protein
MTGLCRQWPTRVSERVSTVTPKSVAPKPTQRYDERLGVPLRWWALGTMFLASVLLAFAVALPLAVAFIASGALTVLMAGLFLGYGAASVSVADGVFRAGPASIPVSLLGEVTPLDPGTTRLLAGVDADARAFLLLRPYLKRSVKVTLADPTDPTPYWLVSTRHPHRLAAALSAAMSSASEGGDARPATDD